MHGCWSYLRLLFGARASKETQFTNSTKGSAMLISFASGQMFRLSVVVPGVQQLLLGKQACILHSAPSTTQDLSLASCVASFVGFARRGLCHKVKAKREKKKEGHRPGVYPCISIFFNQPNYALYYGRSQARTDYPPMCYCHLVNPLLDDVVEKQGASSSLNWQVFSQWCFMQLVVQ